MVSSSQLFHLCGPQEKTEENILKYRFSFVEVSEFYFFLCKKAARVLKEEKKIETKRRREGGNASYTVDPYPADIRGENIMLSCPSKLEKCVSKLLRLTQTLACNIKTFQKVLHFGWATGLNGIAFVKAL